jgi:hypothetical protein
MHQKKHLSFTALRKALSERFKQIGDLRQGVKVEYPLHDCLMSGFAMMLFQDPSLLCFQQRIQDRMQRNNLATLFNVGTIAKDTQMRDVLDTIEPEAIDPIFSDFFLRLQRGKQLVQYQYRNNIVMLVKGGRARWKIENETFNTLKNQGYHIEHNFGHGQHNLIVAISGLSFESIIRNIHECFTCL